ncbi:MAG: low molecular weight phosphatase family protein [Candidatus Bathyarchaeia archaeon]
MFVCSGNTCRSPMAEGIARKMLGPNSHVESAGTHAQAREPPAANAVKTMRDKFGIDISSHRSRNLKEVRIEDFDYVIAMDENVHEELRSRFSSLGERLMPSWNINDPYGEDLRTYEDTAARIQKHVQELTSSHKKSEKSCSEVAERF